MSDVTGDEPDLQLGSTGEAVMLLQVRLYGIGVYRQVPDGAYDMTTETAVRELQSQLGLDNDGVVTAGTWDAVRHQEMQYGIQYQYHSPYDALAQIVYDLEHPQGTGETVSEDGQWRWDGAEWQPVDGAGPGAAGDGWAGQLSPDGQWRWDGAQWQPADGSADGSADAASGAASGAGSDVGTVSEDGQWRWDGAQWQANTAGTGDDYTGLVSDDGQWRWNGRSWEAV